MWMRVIEELKRMNLPYNHLKSGFLAQWILESGRGTSVAFKEYINVAGMKWRNEMAGFAEKVWYATPTEPKREGPNGVEQGDWFCKFTSPLAAVQGYFRFLSRVPYTGWESKTIDAKTFLSFIGPTWCPVGYTDEYKKTHNGMNYHEYVLSLIPEAEKLLAKIEVSTPVPEATSSEPGEVTWLELNRGKDGASVITAWAGDKPILNVFGTPAISVPTLKKILEVYPKAGSLLVADTENKPIPSVTTATTLDQIKTTTKSSAHRKPLDGMAIALDPGHGSETPGAFGKGAYPPSEYAMNALQARIIANELRNQGATVTIYDPPVDNLEAVAMGADGKTAFISLHHNAANADGVDEGTETHIHHKATAECESFAKMVNDAICAELKTKNRGVKRSGFTVLSVSTRTTNCKLNILTESYFIDDYSSKEVTTDRSSRAAYAIAKAITEFLGNKGAVTATPVAEKGPIPAWSGIREFKRGENILLSKNFHLSEFECRSGAATTLVNGDHVQKLQAFRDRLGKPIRITSGYRTPEHNRRIGGASQSQHIYGCATDIYVDGMPASEVYALADQMFDGVGKYKNFTHVDSRGTKARW